MATGLTAANFGADGVTGSDLPGVPTTLDPNPLNRQPENTNYLQPTAFRFFLHRNPAVTYFCQSTSLPGIELGAIEQSNMFANVKQINSKPVYENLNVTFTVDEKLKNWLEIHDWMRSVSNFEDFDDYIIPEGDHFSDATLIITTNAMNPSVEVSFKNCFPVSLSAIEFDSTVSEIEPLSSTATFAYDTYSLRVI
jgi:hypothetical protein|tara:strand:- start:8 stop:592 length:585 start_codon:yes stop_codon:yes gene_type:complete